MTDTQQNLFQKKPDEENELAEKLASSKSRLTQELSSLNPSIKKEFLTTLKGVGPHLAEILIGAGIRTIKELTHSKAPQLAQIKGIGQVTAQKIIEAAREHLQTKNLNEFTQLEEHSNSTHAFVKEMPSRQKLTQNESDFKLNLSASTPLVIDGSNIAWHGGNRDKGDIPEVKYIIELRMQLLNIGFTKIIIFCDPSLPRVIDDKKTLKHLIEEKIVILTPNEIKEIDDHYVLQYAKKVDGYVIVEKDKYRNWYKQYGKKWVKSKRITSTYVEGIFLFTPDIEVVNDEINEEDDIELLKEESKRQNDPWFDEKYKYSRLTGSNNHTEPAVEFERIEGENYEEAEVDYEDALEEEEPVISDEHNEKIHIAPDEAPIAESQEVFTSHKDNSLIEKLYKKVQSSEFSIINEIKMLRSMFVGIDALALKIIHVDEFLDLLCIVPIIVSRLEGTFTVSADSIEYIPKNHNKRTIQAKKISQSYIKALQKSEMTIFNDISNKGELLKYIMKYLDIEISPEKTITNKTLFLRSGPLQYKLLIEPLIICNTPVSFTEKLVPFAYQRQSNIHVIDISQVSDLLHYLDEKYFLIETYSEKKNILTVNSETEDKFMKNIRIGSSPFIFYGFTLLLIFLCQGFSLLPLLINIGYGVVGLYMVVIGYIYVGLYRQKKQIKEEFATPYYLRDLGVDEESLLLINEKLTSILMEQFGYEILGKNPDSAVIKKIEHDNTRSYLSQKIIRKQVEGAELFEEDISKPEIRRPKINSESIEKYSSFLED